MAREEKTITVVHCAKLDQELPALARPPFPGPLGLRIYESVSAYAYRLWTEQATLLINHHGLNLADPRAQDYIFQQMEAFLFNEGTATDVVAATPAKGSPRK